MGDLKENSLVRVAVNAAINAAARYLKVNDLDFDEVLLRESLKQHVKVRIDKALDDAKAAIDCGMSDVAEQTFVASMVLAGIEAAKEVGKPKVQLIPKLPTFNSNPWDVN